MMSSESSTERGRSGRADTGLHPWHFFLLLSMAAATWAVVVARHTQPAALILISAAVIATGLVGAAMHHAVAGFLGLTRDEKRPLPTRARQSIEADKALVLRSIKELEFDRAMGKVNNADFAELGGRLRSRALALMEELDQTASSAITRSAAPGVTAPVSVPSSRSVDVDRAVPSCVQCGTPHDLDARFCKNCGARVA